MKLGENAGGWMKARTSACRRRSPSVHACASLSVAPFPISPHAKPSPRSIPQVTIATPSSPVAAPLSSAHCLPSPHTQTSRTAKKLSLYLQSQRPRPWTSVLETFGHPLETFGHPWIPLGLVLWKLSGFSEILCGVVVLVRFWMMAMAVGELGLGLRSSAAPAAAAGREKSVAQNGPSRGATSAHFWTRVSQKVDLRSSNVFGRVLGFGVDVASTSTSSFSVRASSVAPEKSKNRYPGEKKGFVEEMRFVAMKLHTKDQSKEGEKEADVQPVGQWKPSISGYIKFLVDSKKVYDTMETVVEKASHPSYELFRNTGLERSAKLAKDLEWFASQGHEIPEAGNEGTTYANFLTELSETDVPAFICHFYNVYFAHSAGGRFIGKQVAQQILDGKELEFYKWDGELSELLGAVKVNLNKVAEEWTREQKDHCLKETENSFKYSGKILRLIVSAE